MHSNTSPAAKAEARASDPALAGMMPARGVAPLLRGRRWRWGLVTFGGLIAVVLSLAFIRAARDPVDLARAEAAYRRNELTKALQLAEAQLVRSPSSRSASLLVARCLSRLGQPDRA